MKWKYLLIVLAVGLPLLLATPAFALISTGDGAWVWQNQQPQGNGGNGVSFPDVKHGWATGWWGTIIATSDGGETWVAQDSGTDQPLCGISFVDAKRGWTVGYAGVIRHTTDGGRHWATQNAGYGNNLYGISFPDATHGWICGADGLILSTSNGGLTWKRQYRQSDYNLVAVSFADDKHGWAVGTEWVYYEDGWWGYWVPYGIILRTVDGGATWTRKLIEGQSHYGVSAVDGTHAWISSDGKVLRTADGSHWASVATGTSGPMWAVTFVDRQRGWTSSEGGFIAKTTNGGQSWSAQYSTVSDGLNAIWFVDAYHGCAIGNGGWPVITSDGGVTWRQKGSNITFDNFYAVSFADPTHGWVGGQYGDLYVTADGGTTWTAQSTGTASDVSSVSAVDATHAWLTAGNLVLGTSDGVTWSQHLPSAVDNFNDIDFIDARMGCVTGWHVGDDGYARASVFTTTDGGATWTTHTEPSPMYLNAVAMANASTAWAVGDNGSILKTSDGGQTWTPQASGMSVTLTDIACFDAVHVIAVWQYGVLVSADGGATWTNIATDQFGSLTRLAVEDGSHAIAVGPGGTVIATSDAGLTWAAQKPGTKWDFTGVACAGPNDAWIVGTGGIILATQTGGWPPPTLAWSGAKDGAWYHAQLTVDVAATARPPATGIAGLDLALDGGDPQHVAAGTGSILVPVDAVGHSLDGAHVVTCVATDDLGHAGRGAFTVNIDTQRPIPGAFASNGFRGGAGGVRFHIDDLPPNAGTATVVVKIRNPRNVLVKTLKFAVRTLDVTMAKKFSVPSTWKTGTYKFFVYVKDGAGNAQLKPAVNNLVIK